MHFDSGKKRGSYSFILYWRRAEQDPICVLESTRTIRVGADGAPQILTSEAERSPPQERPQQFLMWVVTNIPGNNVHLGNEIFEYLAPLAIELDGKEFNKDYSPHVSPYLVFEQQERVSL